MKKTTDCTFCAGMGVTLIKKAGRVSMKKCLKCGGSGKAKSTKSTEKKPVKKTKAEVRKASKVKVKGQLKKSSKAERMPKFVAPKGLTVVSRDLETGEDVTTKMTPDQREAKETIEERASFFGCPGKVMAVRKGPVITLYEFQPAKSTRIRRLINLQEDLALALSADAVMVRRIAGKDVMGIEISNESSERQNVGFRASLQSVRSAKAKGMELPLNLGTDPFGEPIIDDLATMPHLLIAGSTGAGKSVSLNCIISSLLTVCTPEELEFYMIDPKGVELMHYNGIPHMKEAMVTSPHRAKEMLEKLVREMRRRLNLLSYKGVRDIKEYNGVVEGSKSEAKLPRIVCVIDELGDLMMQDRKEFTRLIAEISQIARATGIHMVAATQRPSVDVLSGRIKVNFPARMAFKVTSMQDSRVILHMKGAEGLLGRGDMLYLSPSRASTIRIHAPWVPLTDVKVIADRLRKIEAERREAEEKVRLEAERKRIEELRKREQPINTIRMPEEPKVVGDEDLDIDFSWTNKKS